MSIFKNLGKSLKKAAPLIGAGIGMYFGGPAGYAALGGGLGAGIGTLVGGGDIKDALFAGALGYGAGSLAQGAGMFKAATGATAGTTAATTKGIAANQAAQQAAAAEATAPLTFGSSISPEAVKIAGEASASSPGILEGIAGFASENPLTTAALGTGVLGLLASGEPEQEQFNIPETREGRPYETKVRGPITGTIYNLANKDERLEYNNELLQLREENFKYKDGGEHVGGGEVDGPGTGTSDSVPARLSDGEFVLTAKAVRGAGNGDRDIGAARMYDMMAELESMA